MMESLVINLPDGPIITVHKGWIPSKTAEKVVNPVHDGYNKCFETHTFSVSRKGKGSAFKPQEEETPLAGQVFQAARPRVLDQQIDFVNNASEPLQTKDATVRKLVRSHAMKAVARERREQKKTSLKGAMTTREKAREANEVSLPSQRPIEGLSRETVNTVPLARDQEAPYALLDLEFDYYFTDYLSKLQANRYRLETLYFAQLGSAMFPMEFHLAYNPPMQLVSFDSSFVDNVVIQSLSYAAAVCSTLAKGKRNSTDITVQMNKTIRFINRLLEGERGVADGMFGAVIHLAMGEALRGNFDDWAMHMNGLKKMVEMRGGMDRIHFYLRMKLHRADLLGSTDQASRPFFPFKRSYHLAKDLNPYLPAHDILLDWSKSQKALSTRFIGTTIMLRDLRHFSRAIEQTLLEPEARHPKELIEACYSIQYQLLLTGPPDDVTDGGFVHDIDEQGNAFRLGAIIYMKEILQDFSFSVTGSRILVSKLKTSLSIVLVSQPSPSSSALLLWLLVMGGIASIRNRLDKTLFVTHLVRLCGDLLIIEWKDLKERLESILWIGNVLDKAGEALWDEIQLTARALG